jgi:hypothetical protein
VAGGGGDSVPVVSKSKRGRGLRGWRRLGGRNEEDGRQFGLATHAWRRAADDSAWGGGGSGETREEEGPGGPVLGRKVVVTWASVGISKEKSRQTSMAIGLN